MFRNGDKIKQVKTLEEFQASNDQFEPVWMHYLNNPANDAKYGKLYNWWAVIDDRGLAPEGWHIPTKEDWEILFCSYQKDLDISTMKIPGKNIGTRYTGCYYGIEGEFGESVTDRVIGHWSSTRVTGGANIYTCKSLHHLGEYGHIQVALNVLCVKDKTNPFIPQIDSNKIEFYPKPIFLKNSQVWCTDYLNVTTFNNGDTIPEANEDWLWEKYIREKKPAWCYSKRGKNWGKLYNYYAVTDSRGITPKGLRIPTIIEWQNSTKFNVDKDIMTNQNIPIWKIGYRYDDGQFDFSDELRLERQELGIRYSDVWVLSSNSSSEAGKVEGNSLVSNKDKGYPIICIYDY